MKEKKTMAVIIVLLAVLVIIGGVVIGLLLFGGDGTRVIPSPSATADGPEGMTQPVLCAVETQYGTLYFQEKWAPFMQVEQEMSEDVLDVSFAAVLQEQTLPLFRLSIGAPEGNAPSITDEQGSQRNVYVSVDDTVDVSALSVEDQTQYYAMQEEINIIIDNLKQK